MKNISVHLIKDVIQVDMPTIISHLVSCPKPFHLAHLFQPMEKNRKIYFSWRIKISLTDQVITNGCNCELGILLDDKIYPHSCFVHAVDLAVPVLSAMEMWCLHSPSFTRCLILISYELRTFYFWKTTFRFRLFN